jgi:hypothetical protein
VIATAAAIVTGTARRAGLAGGRRLAAPMSCIQCRTVTPRPFRMMGVSMNRHEADARAIVTPVSTSHDQGELAPRPASAVPSAITGQCHR